MSKINIKNMSFICAICNEKFDVYSDFIAYGQIEGLLCCYCHEIIYTPIKIKNTLNSIIRDILKTNYFYFKMVLYNMEKHVNIVRGYLYDISK